MSLLIKGMEMPKVPTRVIIFADGRVEDEDDSAYKYSAVPVPPHGRVIDADALTRTQGFHDFKYANGLVYVSVREVVSLINAAPTIIPAEPPKEES